MAHRCERCFGAISSRQRWYYPFLILIGARSSLPLLRDYCSQMKDVSTSLDMTRSLLEDRRIVWLVAAIAIFLFLIGNLPWQLDDYDQAKQAFTSFEMIKDGRWFYQQTPREHVATKPPLVGWLSAGIFSLTRSWEMAWRLPSLLAAIAIAIQLFRAASLAYGTIAGVIALSAFGLNLLSPRLATLVRTDMPLAFVIFLIGLLIWRKIREQEAWEPRDRIYIFALLTVAMLIKGPIVYAFLLPGIALFQWRCRRHAVVAGVGNPGVGAVSPCNGSSGERLDIPIQSGLQSAWCGWWPWIASLGIFLLWLIGGILFQPGFFNEVVMREFIGRFGETIHRPQPIYFYLPHLLHKFAPWSVLMIAIVIFDLPSRRWKIGAAFQAMSPQTFWLLCWSLGGLVVMSLIPSKRVDRVFPIVPPLCLLLAAQIGSIFRNEQLRTRIYRWSAVALILSILITGGYTVAKVIFGYRDHRDALVLFGRDVRNEAETHHWRYEVVSAQDEGLFLYLRRTHFIRPDRAIAEWNRGNLDALVAPADKAPALMRELHGAVLSELKSNERKGEPGRDYVLITR
jgi:4-amino-4-deoxy-L-arabinose transferase-like glycosyltransferase